jgi:hypothetical protein
VSELFKGIPEKASMDKHLTTSCGLLPSDVYSKFRACQSKFRISNEPLPIIRFTPRPLGNCQL